MNLLTSIASQRRRANYDADAADYFARAEALGGSFDQSGINPIYTAEYIKTAISNFVAGCKADGTWALTPEIYLMVGVSFGGILAKLKYSSNPLLLQTGGDLFVASDHIAAGSGSGLSRISGDKRLSTQQTPQSVGLSSTNCFIGIYLTANTAGGAWFSGNVFSNPLAINGYQLRTPLTTFSFQSLGHMSGGRSGNVTKLYRNASLFATGSDTQTFGVHTATLFSHANGATQEKPSGRMAMAHLNLYLDETQAVSFAGRVNNLMIELGAFTPLFLSPSLWLDSSDSTTLYDATTGGNLVVADGTVALWQDKSGNARHATQSTALSRPLRKTSIKNGKDILQFDGTNDFFNITNVGNLFQNKSEAWIFLVVSDRNRTGGDFSHVIFAANASGSNHRVISLTKDNANIFNLGGRRLDSDTFRGVSTNSLDGYSILTQNMKWSGNSIVGIRNGQIFATNTFSSGGGNSSNTAVSATIGRQSVTAQGFSPSDIAEIIVFETALTDTDRQSVENYLNAKWAVY